MDRVQKLHWSALALAVLCAPGAADAQPTSAPFTLQDALARARDESPEGAVVEARVEAARQAIDHAGRLRNPVVDLRTENMAPGLSRSVLPLDTFAEIRQVIEIGGKRAARRGMAETELGIMQAAEASARYHLALDVSRGYLLAVRHRERHRALAAQTTDLAELVRVLDRRVSVGTTAEADLLKLRTEEARAATDMLRAELAADRALVELTARLNVDATLDALTVPAPPPPPVAGPGAGLERRPDVAAAMRAVEAARQTLRLEDARGVPDPVVSAGLKRTAGYNTGLIAVALPIPLFDRNQAARIVAGGQVRAAELQLAATERRARGELAATRTAAIRLSARAREARARLVEPARGARDAARSAFQSGALDDVLRLVDAERVYTEAALVTIDLELDAVGAAIEARLAAGEDPLP